jgi:hypothetical protein
MAALPFHSYRLRAKKGAQTRLLNCYAVTQPEEGRGPVMIQGMAGIETFSELESGPQRAAIKFNGALYSVAGNYFVRTDVQGNSTIIDSFDAGTDLTQVDIGKLVGQVAVLIQPNLWVYDGSTLTKVTDPDFVSRGAKRMAVMDNFGAFIEPNSGRWFICDLADFTVYDPLDFATAEVSPDNLLSIESNNHQFVLFGEDTIELWDPIGGSGFPYERNPNGFVECGLSSSKATCTADNTVYWLDNLRMARRLEGNIARRISNDGVEQRWQQYSTVADAETMSYTYDGHTFVVYTFPSAGATWVYDINTQEWHERDSHGYGFWRASWVVNAYEKTFVGDRVTGNIGELNSNVYTEWGRTLRREATTGVLYDAGRWIYHDLLELMLDVGSAPILGQGSSPQIMLDVSDDAGVTFRARSNRDLGAVGKYSTKVHWDRCGRSKERVYRFRVSDPLPFVVLDAQAQTR